MNNNFGTGIWNNLKNPYVYSSAAIGLGIGIYEASTIKGIQGNEIELGALGAITGAVIGIYQNDLMAYRSGDKYR